MRISPQISSATIVLLGHFNPLIFRPEWFREKEIVIASDFDGIQIQIEHPEIVAFNLPWGGMNVDRNRFMVSVVQEPIVRAQDFFVACFQRLPETPITAIGMNREVHFVAGSANALHHIGDTLAPKEFWTDFVTHEGKRTGGLRSITMEQAIPVDGQLTRLDGVKGFVRVTVEPSVRIPNGAFVMVNDHYDLTTGSKLSDGRRAAELVAANWETSIQRAEQLVDRIMELANASR